MVFISLFIQIRFDNATRWLSMELLVVVSPSHLWRMNTSYSSSRIWIQSSLHRHARSSSNKIIPKLHDKAMQRVVDHIKLAKNVALTLDIWTDRRQHSCLGITAHTFLNCIPQSLLLVLSSFKGSHAGSRIASVLDKAISEFGLQSKVVYCACDNARNMLKAFSA
jgi:hypothetical protein